MGRLIGKLKVNSSNDRHGDLKDESTAIAWLFDKKEDHMKGLANDIVKVGEVYEPPLVVKRNGSYIVYDGNRRVTCMKLLKDPRKAPNKDTRLYFQKLAEKWSGEFPKEITCRIESDIDRVDEILYRRHTGSQSGVGQTTWDGRMKDNFIERTGKSKGKKISDAIENVLRKADKLPTVRQIPRSTLDRLLSSEEYRNIVGISFLRGELKFTHDKSKVTVALQRIATDLASRKIVLGNLWDSKNKHIYLDSLKDEGVLPTESDRIAEDDGNKTGPKPPKPKPPKPKPPKPKPTIRKTLIPQVEHNIIWKDGMTRKRHIWNELEFQLELETHPNAISVLFRVLLELSLDHCSEQNPTCNVKESDKLKQKINKFAELFYKNQKIDLRYKDDLIRMTRNEELVSVTSLNRFVHSYDISPSPSHLRAIWDSLEKFIKLCLRETGLTA